MPYLLRGYLKLNCDRNEDMLGGLSFELYPVNFD